MAPIIPLPSQTIVRLPQPFCPSKAEAIALSPEALAALRRLVGMVQRLRSPAGGWQSELPPTPENLLPYVTEEAADVLEALRHLPEPVAAGSSLASNAPAFYGLDQLSAQLLWAIVGTTYPIMPLIEGVAGQCLLPATAWCNGMLRLVICLEGHAVEHGWQLDLTTLQPATQLLPADAQLAATDGLLRSILSTRTDSTIGVTEPAAQPVAVSLRQLTQQLHRADLALTPFLTGVSGAWLRPGEDWQTGELKLSLGFEFVPEVAEPSTGVEPAASGPVTLSLPTARLKLADPHLLEHYTQRAIQQPLEPLLRSTAFLAGVNSDNLLLPLVTAAYQAADHIYAPASPQFFLIQPEDLTQLLPRLLWNLTSSDYSVMVLLGGVKAEVLQPLKPWQTGILRLAPLLEIRGETTRQVVDLATQQAPSQAAKPLKPWAIARLSPEQLILAPAAVATLPSWDGATLLGELRQRVGAGAPELVPLFEGIAIEQQIPPDEAWQPASLQLHLSLEFFPTS